jgi:magnesium chelatase family protein
VLLLDELAEFQRPALEALRQPLEDGFVLVSRAAGRVVFPARFQLVATMNLCACGGRGDPAAQCSCSAQRLARYRDKLSRALLDRFDLVLAMPRVRGEELSAEPGEGSAAVGRRVVAARDLLATRLPPRDTEADALLRRAAEQPHSPGAVTREWEGCEDDRGTRGVGLGPA